MAPSTWYSLKVFDSLLQLVHRFVYDGSESAAQAMGRHYAQSSIADASEPVVVPGDALATLSRLPARWRTEYNFGEMNVTPLPARDAEHGVRVRVNAFPDMSACHGHAIMGFTVELAEQSGALSPKVLLEERPWMHNSILAYTLIWSES